MIRNKSTREKKLEKALLLCVDLLSRIRDQTWPQEGLGIGLTASEIDEVLYLADPLLPEEDLEG